MPTPGTPIETWPVHPGPTPLIEIVNPEFSHVCPKTGLPDYGTVTVRYVPQDCYVELKALKYYFLGFRNRGISYEDLTQEIAVMLWQLLQPEWLEVQYKANARGGIRSVVTVRMPQQDNKNQQKETK